MITALWLILSASPEVAFAVQPDGMQLATVTVDSTDCAIRIGVRSGAWDDPAGKAGLAHMVEHLAFDGPTGRDVLRQGESPANAYTSSSNTVFTAEAPADECEARLNSILRMLSEGHFRPAWLEHERAVILREEFYFPSVAHLVEHGLFAASQVIGSAKSRASVTNDDVTRFYRDNYRPSNMFVVIVGPLRLDAVVRAVNEAFLIPPERETERPERQLAPALVKGDVERAVYGASVGDYSGVISIVAEVPLEQARLCIFAAALLNLHLSDELSSKRAAAHCSILHGHLFLVLDAQSGAIEFRALDEQKKILANLKTAARSLEDVEGRVRDWREAQLRKGNTPSMVDHNAYVEHLKQLSKRAASMLLTQQALIEKLEHLVQLRKVELVEARTRLDALWTAAAKPLAASDRKFLESFQPVSTVWVGDRPEFVAELVVRVMQNTQAEHAEENIRDWVEPLEFDNQTAKKLPSFIGGLQRVVLVGN